jgi:hypothetical protein
MNYGSIVPWLETTVLLLLCTGAVLPRKPSLVVTGGAAPSRQQQDVTAATPLPQPPA